MADDNVEEILIEGLLKKKKPPKKALTDSMAIWWKITHPSTGFTADSLVNAFYSLISKNDEDGIFEPSTSTGASLSSQLLQVVK